MTGRHRGWIGSEKGGRAGRLGALAAIGAVAVAIIAGSAASGAAALGRSGHHKSAIACPKRAEAALPLPQDAVARAAEAAFRQAPRHFKAIDTRGKRITSSSLGSTEAFLRHQCGERIARRTVVVWLRFPKMQPSAALSQDAVFVSRFRHGYQIWEVSPIKA